MKPIEFRSPVSLFDLVAGTALMMSFTASQTARAETSLPSAPVLPLEMAQQALLLDKAVVFPFEPADAGN